MSVVVDQKSTRTRRLARRSSLGFTPRMHLAPGRLSHGLPRRLAAFLKTASLLALTGCSGGDSGDGDGGGGSSGSGGSSSTNLIELTNASQYTSTSTLMPPEIVTASGEDLQISWDALTTDMQCHGMDPAADIGKVALLRFRGLTKEEAAELLTAGELLMSDIDGYIQYDTGESVTSCDLSDLSNLGTPVDITEEYQANDTNVYMLLWATGTQPGTGARSMVFLRPVVGEVNTEVVAEPACDPDTGESLLTFDATLPAPLDAPETYTTVDWKKVTVDGLGNPIATGTIDRILLAYYEGMTPQELEGQIFDIEMLATDIWEIERFGGGRQADLRSAQHRETDEFFTGFGGRPEGTWLVGLMCSICQNPAPVVLSVLNPVPAPAE
jgi:hypothetical protein